MNFKEPNNSVVAMIDKNNLVKVDWQEVERCTNEYLKGNKDTINSWCFVLWNVKHQQARLLND